MEPRNAEGTYDWEETVTSKKLKSDFATKARDTDFDTSPPQLSRIQQLLGRQHEKLTSNDNADRFIFYGDCVVGWM